jgi:uncharacterized membrane protein YeaQ/YmgE (transglycosylase-associated protein family)
MDLQPGGLLIWLVVGLIAGWAAGQFMMGSGVGLIGGTLIGFLMPGATVGLLGSIVVAFIGAVVLIVLLRALSGHRRFSWRRTRRRSGTGHAGRGPSIARAPLPA